ncbi:MULTISPECIES: hypothetical protein [Mycobacteriaceae]|jgi:hypothetical protein|uniref:Uncharacterized protein n=1 Tax=Mycolicibacterium gadium TaxID=1794 RepID=A0A7I7WSR2_MYCGU|nr:hypothetical protein [Mycolicibacterium gadium]MBY0286987.1 hypothetical protein [Mycobacteriaceae bacterium]MDG5484513.1 hypothetical protein [Mycolicibacterium gadium]BBZ19551.1 hypothetical protein MGAD_38860 [Mycolicibacterium gadium]
MPKGKGIYEDHTVDESEKKGGRPGPTDEGGEGGMATREEAPDVADTRGEPTA